MMQTNNSKNLKKKMHLVVSLLKIKGTIMKSHLKTSLVTNFFKIKGDIIKNHLKTMTCDIAFCVTHY
jgi:hypothetical protein